MLNKTEIEVIKDFSRKYNYLFKRCTKKSIIISKELPDDIVILGEYFVDHVCDRITIGICFDNKKDYLSFDIEYNLKRNIVQFYLPQRFAEWKSIHRSNIIELFKFAINELTQKILDLPSLIDLLEDDEQSKIFSIDSKDKVFYRLFWKTLFSKDYILAERLLDLYLKYVPDSNENHDIKYAKLMLVQLEKKNIESEEIERIKNEWIFANKKRSGI